MPNVRASVGGPAPVACAEAGSRPLPRGIRGDVVETVPNATFTAARENRHTVLNRLAGKMRRDSIRVLPGDGDTVEFFPCELSRGRITYRHR